MRYPHLTQHQRQTRISLLMVVVLSCATSVLRGQEEAGGIDPIIPAEVSAADDLLPLTKESLSDASQDAPLMLDMPSLEPMATTPTFAAETPTLVSGPDPTDNLSDIKPLDIPALDTNAADTNADVTPDPAPTSTPNIPQPTNFALKPPQNWQSHAYGNARGGAYADSLWARTTPTGNSGWGTPSQSIYDFGSHWAQLDYLFWQLHGYRVPALITRSSGSVQNNAGAIGGEGTQVLFGNEELGDDLLSGGRLQFGHWFDASKSMGVQVEFLGLGEEQTQEFVGNGSDIFARPFFNTNDNVNAPDAQVFSMPGIAEGSVRLGYSTEIWSTATALRFNHSGQIVGPHGSSQRFDLLLGYRFFRFEETFTSLESIRPLDPSFDDGTRFELSDRIRTRNDFHGIELGLDRQFQRGRWAWGVTGLCALGNVSNVVDLNGRTRTVIPGEPIDSFPGGFYVGSQAVGRFSEDRFAVIPQLRANLSFRIFHDFRLSVGYNLTYLNSVIRPGQFVSSPFDGNRLGQDATSIDTSLQSPNLGRDDMVLYGATFGLSREF